MATVSKILFNKQKVKFSLYSDLKAATKLLLHHDLTHDLPELRDRHRYFNRLMSNQGPNPYRSEIFFQVSVQKSRNYLSLTYMYNIRNSVNRVCYRSQPISNLNLIKLVA